MKYLVFLDIDGTLMSRGQIHPRTLAAIRRAKENGHKIYINTGRSLSIVPQNIIDEVKPDGYVCAIGMCVIIDGAFEVSRCLSDSAIVKMLEFSKETSVKVLLEGENVTLSYGGSDRLLSPEREIFSFEDMKERYGEAKIQKFTFMRPVEEDEKAFFGSDLYVLNHPRYSEIAMKGCSKASGMEYVCRRLGFDKERVIAMGDSVNDIEMLKCAGVAVAMGNATDDVKEIADFVSIPCDEGGVGYAIEKLIFKE